MWYEVSPGDFAMVVAISFLAGPSGCQSEIARLKLGDGGFLQVDGIQAAGLRREMTKSALPVCSTISPIGEPPCKSA